MIKLGLILQLLHRILCHRVSYTLIYSVKIRPKILFDCVEERIDRKIDLGYIKMVGFTNFNNFQLYYLFRNYSYILFMVLTFSQA